MPLSAFQDKIRAALIVEVARRKSSPPNERAFGNPNSAPRRQLRRLRHSVFGIGRRFLEVARHSSKPA